MWLGAFPGGQGSDVRRVEDRVSKTGIVAEGAKAHEVTAREMGIPGGQTKWNSWRGTSLLDTPGIQ